MKATLAAAAREVTRELAGLARPSAGFDAKRYLRDTGNLAFYNVRAPRVRALAKALARSRPDWTIADATALADVLIRDRHLETKAVGIELLARYRRTFTPRLLALWKRWLARGDAANWATTDAMCGLLIGPLLLAHPALAGSVARWARHRNLWVRRAAAAGLIPSARKGLALDEAYGVARRLHADEADLIQKAAGWLLREAGKADSPRLARYLRANGRRIPRTTVRYAIERFPPPERRALLAATRQNPARHSAVDSR